MILHLFMLCSLVAFVLIIWFRTEAFVEYCRLFKLNRISCYKDYDEKKKNDVSLTYHGYFRQYHNGFITRMIACPVCVAVWLSMGAALLALNLTVFPFIFVIGLILFGTVDRLLPHARETV